ncbi:hypothetical protein [Paenibacillus kandeliae]|uniref:hypothetical protein n=1 Tax=Paenibacillus kandeliae TaxID=3231269 RepID=UPI003458816D
MIIINKYILIDLILDANTTDVEKDDAIIELGEHFCDSEMVDFLVELSNDEKVDHMLSASCRESIAHIWLHSNHIEYDKLLKLIGSD